MSCHKKRDNPGAVCSVSPENIDYRKRRFEEWISTVHMICVLILVTVLILDNGENTQIYPANAIRIYIYFGTAAIGMIALRRANTLIGRYPVLKDSYYMLLPLAVSVLAVYSTKGNAGNIQIMFLLPVIVSASVKGALGGTLTAAYCSGVLVFYYVYTQKQSIAAAFEGIFITSSVMFLLGWLIGTLIKNESEYSEELKKSLEDLKREMLIREKMEKEVARLDRLNLVGEMAAAIGHEIRNPMTTVRGFLQLMSAKLQPEDKKYLALMVSELDRANAIITEFLSLAKNKPVEKKPVNLNDIIKTVEPLLNADILKNNMNLQIELGDIPCLQLDEKEMRQIIFNLVRNGIEAMEPGGTITISTCAGHNEIVLSVADSGKGIEPEILEKLGTPFFTTKEAGTGLGLAVCYSIAARHNAKIDVETGPAGTTFSVKFPLGTPG